MAYTGEVTDSNKFPEGIFKYGKMPRIRHYVDFPENNRTHIKLLNSEWSLNAIIAKNEPYTIKLQSRNRNKFVFNNSTKITFNIINPAKGTSLSTESVKLFENDHKPQLQQIAFNKAEFDSLKSPSVKLNAMLCADTNGTDFIAEGFGWDYKLSSPSNPYDVVLVVNGSKYYVLKEVLATCSCHFARRFFGDNKLFTGEKLDINVVDSIVMPNESEKLEADEFKSLLKIIYGNTEEKIGAENFDFLLKMAVQFDVPMLLSQFEDYIRLTNFNRRDTCGLCILMSVIEFAANHNKEFLLNVCLNRVRMMDRRDRSEFLMLNTPRMDLLFAKNPVVGSQLKLITLGLPGDSVPVKLLGQLTNYIIRKKQRLCIFRSPPGVNCVELIVKGYKFKYPKQYLALCSGYFDKVIFGNNNVCEKIKVDDVNPKQFRTLLQVIYPNSPETLTDENVLLITELAGSVSNAFSTGTAWNLPDEF